jgi:hypothetical protein
MRNILLTLILVGLVYAGQASAAPLRLSYSIVGPPVAGVWMTYETGALNARAWTCSSSTFHRA